MGKTLLKALFILMASALMFGCAAQQPMTVFKAHDLNSMLQSGDYVQKVDNFMVIIDGSGSMSGAELRSAKDTASRMSQTIPDLKLKAGLRRFGLGDYGNTSPTALLYGVTSYTKEGFEGGLRKLRHGNGGSPLGMAIDAASEDLKSVQGNIALIVITDGQEMKNTPVNAAIKMKSAYSDRLCIYTVLVGNDPEGTVVLDRVAMAGKCGFATHASDLASPSDMADFVGKVFMARVVKPEPPKPEPPKPVVVPPKPKDSDGDGVYDDKDKCPETPMGTSVNADGCWVIKNVEFDTDKWDIRPLFEAVLDQVASVMKKNPWLKVEVQGHTDIRASAEHNQRLSERRAESVKDYLVAKGISSDRLSTVGFGFNRPIASNNTEDGMARNRRSEIMIVR